MTKPTTTSKTAATAAAKPTAAAAGVLILASARDFGKDRNAAVAGQPKLALYRVPNEDCYILAARQADEGSGFKNANEFGVIDESSPNKTCWMVLAPYGPFAIAEDDKSETALDYGQPLPDVIAAHPQFSKFGMPLADLCKMRDDLYAAQTQPGKARSILKVAGATANHIRQVLQKKAGTRLGDLLSMSVLAAESEKYDKSIHPTDEAYAVVTISWQGPEISPSFPQREDAVKHLMEKVAAIAKKSALGNGKFHPQPSTDLLHYRTQRGRVSAGHVMDSDINTDKVWALNVPEGHPDHKPAPKPAAETAEQKSA